MTPPTSAGPSGPRDAEDALIAGYPAPPRLAQAHDPGVVAWRETVLPGMVEGLLEEWSLVPGRPFAPGGSTAWVAPVRDRHGASLVLKVACAHDESRDEAAGMTAWQGYGAARVLRTELQGRTSVLLMERVRPGTPLSQVLPWDRRDEVIAALLRRLWSAPIPGQAGFRPLEQMCSWWADEARQRQASREQGPSLLPHGLPPGLVEHGLGLFRELPRRWDGEEVLLATDLHHENVLAAGRSGTESPGSAASVAGRPGTGRPGTGRSGTGRPGTGSPRTASVDDLSWVLIDPKPYVGDPHYDVLQHVLNDPERLVSDPSGLSGRMAALTGLDPQRVRRWLLARCVQETGVLEGAEEAALRLAADGVE